MNNNNVLIVRGLHNPDISRKSVIFDRCKPKQGYLSKVRVRIDDGKQIHYLGNVDCLINYFSVETCLSLLNGFSHSGLDCYTRHMRSGLKVEIFEI